MNLGGRDRFNIVLEAGEGMGKYHGTRWPLEATFTTIEAPRRVVYEARSWTEGEQDTTIEQVNDLELSETHEGTAVILRVAMGDVGSGAKMAAF